MREWWSKIRRSLQRRRDLDDDLGEEMHAHLDFLIEENIARGMPPAEARAAARQYFGNETATRERAHEAWQFPRLETILQDLRYGLRGIRRSPGFSLVVILTLALGIGANTAIFSVVYSVLLRPLPYPAGERLLELEESTPSGSGISVTWINFQHWRVENHSFEDMAGFHTADLTMTGRGDAVLTHAAVVTNGFFHLTGSRPLLGRLFTETDDRPGAAPTVLVTNEFWASTLGADPGVLGSTLVLNGKAYQIIGVLRPGLKFFIRPMNYYLPLGLFEENTVKRNQHGSIRVLALLKPGVTLAAGRADLDAIMRRLAQEDPGPENDHRAFATFLTESQTRDIRLTLFVLLGAVGLVLLLACANVASLLLVRSTARTREIAIRTAVGAGQARLARQLLTENLIIAALGGGLGLLLAGFCLRTLVVMGPSDIPRLSEATLDLQVLMFAAAITITVGLLSGVAPVFTAGKVDLTLALKEGSTASGAGRRWQSFRSILVVTEIAITLVLAFASGLLLRSLIAAQDSYPGFDSRHLLALELQLPPSRYKNDDAARQYYRRLIQDLRAEPGIKGVGAVNCPPAAGDCNDWWYSILGKPVPSRSDVPLSLLNIADSAYFRTMRMPLLAGRGFTDADRKGGAPVAVINEEIARKWWRTPREAVGYQVKLGGPYMAGPVYQIVGVVGNVSQMGLDEPPMPELYFPFSQRPNSAMVVMIRTTGDPTSLIPAVRHRAVAIDRNVPIQSLRPFEKWLGATLERRRFSTLLLGVFAALAMILAAVGIYGVLNYWVGVRQNEIAIRLALGAQQSAILRWAASHALRLAAVGIALGALGGWVASRWLKDMVFGISAENPGTMLVAGAAVISIALLAASVPLWRATQVDAVRNLHAG
jgi:putative ABC transport system permease protein